MRYLKGHANRAIDHVLTEIDERSRRAICSRCGETSIKKENRGSINGSERIWRCCRKIITDHIIVDASLETMIGFCRGCMAEVPIKLYSGRLCCAQQRSKMGVRYRLNAKYGLTPEDHAALLANQDGVCSICKGPPGGHDVYHVDHDHVSGQVRGLLCARCNQGIGYFLDDPILLRAAADYIERARG